MPSPTIFWAKAGSGTCSIGRITPESGALRLTCGIRRFLSMNQRHTANNALQHLSRSLQLVEACPPRFCRIGQFAATQRCLKGKLAIKDQQIGIVAGLEQAFTIGDVC